MAFLNDALSKMAPDSQSGEVIAVELLDDATPNKGLMPPATPPLSMESIDFHEFTGSPVDSDQVVSSILFSDAAA